MLKTCGNSIYKPFEIIFTQALLTDVFPSKWKFLTKFLDFLSLMILFQQTSRVSDLEIHASINYNQLPAKCINHLITD